MTALPNEPPPPPPPPGWYLDPGGECDHRYWDGTAWTNYGSLRGYAVKRALPHPTTVPARTVDLPGRTIVLTIFGALVVGLAQYMVTDPIDDLVLRVLVAFGSLWAGLFAITKVVSMRFGTGSIRADFGFRFRPADLSGGLGAAIAARALSVVAIVAVLVAHGDRDLDAQTGPFEYVEPNDTALYIVLVLAVVGAPVIEELFFRGLLQQSLEPRLGAAGAVAAQAVLFGLVHIEAGVSTLQNLITFAAISVTGATLGFTFYLTRRLGTTIVAHALFNLVYVVAILATR